MAGYIGSKASVVSSGVEHKKTFTITGATTSLTGLNYTVGKVHVFQNGVRLVDGTDYTATNSTTITLTVAAQSGDNVVVISQASYQVALSGIDDQSNATAITIDSSENVGIGTSSPTRQLDVSKAGTAYIRASDTANSVNMDMLAASSGGWIGTQTNHSLMFQTNNTERLRIDSDGLKFHGDTAAANALSDYEEGTWTPVIGGSGSTSGQSYTTQHGSYTKIGRLVKLKGYVVLSSIGTISGAYCQIQGLPFTVTGVQGYGGGNFPLFQGLSTNVSQLTAYPEGNSTFAYVLYTAGAGTNTSYLTPAGVGSAPHLMFNMTYFTNQ